MPEISRFYGIVIKLLRCFSSLRSMNRAIFMLCMENMSESSICIQWK